MNAAIALGSLCSGVLLAASALAQEAVAPARVQLDYGIPEACGTEEAFRALVREHVGGVVFTHDGDADLRIVLTATVEPAVGELRVIDADGGEATRRVSASDCAEVHRALSFVVAVAIDPAVALTAAPEQRDVEPAAGASEPAPDPPRESESEQAVSPGPEAQPRAAPAATPAPDAPESPSEAAANAKRRPWALVVGAGGSVETGVSDAPTLGVVAGLGAEISALDERDTRVSVGLAWSRGAPDAVVPIDLEKLAARIDACGPAWRPLGPRWWLAPCFAAELGQLSGRRSNVLGATPERAPWVTLGVGPGVGAELGILRIRVAGGARWHIVDDTFSVELPSGAGEFEAVVVHDVPQFGWFGAVMLDLAIFRSN